MTLKIERFRARVRLSGELRSEHLDQLKTELRKCGKSAVLDLDEVNLAVPIGPHWMILWPFDAKAAGLSTVMRDDERWLCLRELPTLTFIFLGRRGREANIAAAITASGR